MKSWLHLVVAVVSAGLLAACGGGTGSPTDSGPTLADAAKAEPNASEFMKLARPPARRRSCVTTTN